MAAWIHCNRCFARYQKAIEFHLVECGHIFCPNCTSKCKNENACVICKTHTSNMMVISKTMPEDTKIFFKDATGMLTITKQVCEYQMRNYNKLVEHLTNKCNSLKSEALKQYHATVACRKEISRLKDYIRKAVATRGYSSSTPHSAPKAGSTFMDVTMSSVIGGNTSLNSNNNFPNGQRFPGYAQRVPTMEHQQRMGPFITPSPQFVPVHRGGNPMSSTSSSTLRSMQRLAANPSRR